MSGWSKKYSCWEAWEMAGLKPEGQFLMLQLFHPYVIKRFPRTSFGRNKGFAFVFGRQLDVCWIWKSSYDFLARECRPLRKRTQWWPGAWLFATAGKHQEVLNPKATRCGSKRAHHALTARHPARVPVFDASSVLAPKGRVRSKAGGGAGWARLLCGEQISR